MAASEAKAAWRGGVAAAPAATGGARSTIGRGLAELGSGRDDRPGWVRRPGGGRKPATATQPGLLDALRDLVAAAIRGDPEAALLWVNKSQRHLAQALIERGFVVSHMLVGRLLKQLGFSPQANRKTREGASHPDREAQFDHINARIEVFQADGQPTVSADTKKKELVGAFKNGGRKASRSRCEVSGAATTHCPARSERRAPSDRNRWAAYAGTRRLRWPHPLLGCYPRVIARILRNPIKTTGAANVPLLSTELRAEVVDYP